MNWRVRPSSVCCRPNPGGKGASLTFSQYSRFSMAVDQHRSTAPSPSLNHRSHPSPAREFESLLSHPLLAAMATVSGVALGNAIVIETPLFAQNVHAALSCGLVAEDPETWVGTIDRITLPLRREQDIRLTALGGHRSSEIRAEIRRIKSQRDGFFGGAVVRDPSAVASFADRIRKLEALLRPALLIEHAPVGSLENAAARSGGSLLAVCNENLFGGGSGARRDLELLVRTWQGKSSQTALLQNSAVSSPVRPLFGALFPMSQAALARLACSEDPLIRQFIGQLILLELPERPLALPDCWFDLMGRLVASSGQERHLTLTTAAHDRLAAYLAEVERPESGQNRLSRQGPTLALKMALVFHSWSWDPGRDISAETMNLGITIARTFVQASASTATRCVVAKPGEALDEEQRQLLVKIEASGPLSIRELQRKHDKISVEELEAKLRPLIARGKVRHRTGGLLEAVRRTVGAHVL